MFAHPATQGNPELRPFSVEDFRKLWKLFVSLLKLYVHNRSAEGKVDFEVISFVKLELYGG